MSADFKQMAAEGWERRKPSDEQISGLKRVYYSEFVDFCFADERERFFMSHLCGECWKKVMGGEQ